jgi:hypothetical protein
VVALCLTSAADSQGEIQAAAGKGTSFCGRNPAFNDFEPITEEPQKQKLAKTS